MVLALVLSASLPLASSAQQHHHDHHRDSVERWEPLLDDPERDRWQKPEHVNDLLALSPGMTVVDLGAGTGYFLAPLSRAVGPGGRVLALDVDDELVHHMTDRARDAGLDNVQARRIPADDPELPAASVDRVLVVNVWHHLDGRAAYARRLHDALRPGGFVLVVEYTMDSPRGPSLDHRLPPEQLIATLERAGLEVEVVDEELPWQYAVTGTRPAASPRSGDRTSPETGDG